MLVVRPRVGLGLAASAVAVAAAGVGIAVATVGDDGIDSGIVGRLLCPVVLERDTACSETRIVVRERWSHRRVTTAKPNRLGRFRVPLEPGDYLIELRPPSRAEGSRRPSSTVRVPPHRFVPALIAGWPITRHGDVRQLLGH